MNRSNQSKCVVMMKFGSHLYGTSTPASDLDYKSVWIPPAKNIILQQANVCSLKMPASKTKAEGEKNQPGDVDNEAYTLQKFLTLVAKSETVGIDMLFAPPEMNLQSSDLWRHLQANAMRLISKKSSAFVGYCRAQANKYSVKGERVAAVRAATGVFEQAMKQSVVMKVSEVCSALQILIDDNPNHMGYEQQQVNPDGTLGWFFNCCNRKVNLEATVKHAYEIYKGVLDGYGHRALLAETNSGVDWKAVSHAVRVAKEAIELMTTGRVTFPLRDAAHILEVKQGKIPYKDVGLEIDDLLIQVEEATANSILPDKPDNQFIEDVIHDAYLGQVLEPYNIKVPV